MSDDAPLFTPGVAAPGGELGRTLWFAFRRRELLVTDGHELRTLEKLSDVGLEAQRSLYLGVLDDLHCFCAELPADASAPEGYRFADMRVLLGQFEGWLHALAGRAIQILDWDRTHRFCGACATPTELLPGERARRCPACSQLFYPRLAPAIIVAVERRDEILLGRGPAFPPGIHSVLAGFVEPGESLEEAVRREVREEAGIEVDEVRYFGSQPWPFPNSVMLGFVARYASGEIRPDGDELEAADFYRWDELPRIFPGQVSIAQWLIRDFVERHRAAAQESPP